MRPGSEGALESALEMEPRSTHLALFQSLANFWHFLGFRFATPQAIIRARLRRLGGLGPRKANRSSPVYSRTISCRAGMAYHGYVMILNQGGTARDKRGLGTVSLIRAPVLMAA